MQKERLTPMGGRIYIGMASTGIRSISALARQVGVSHQTARRWMYEPGIVPDAPRAFKLGEVLKLSSRWLVIGDGQPTPRIAVLPNERKFLCRLRKLREPQREILDHCIEDLLITT